MEVEAVEAERLCGADLFLGELGDGEHAVESPIAPGDGGVDLRALSVEAEEAGWHGVFVWDHVRWREPVSAVADPWITLATVAAATQRVRLGPVVTPLAA